MATANQSKKYLLIGIIGCLLYVIGDFLFAATGKGQTEESIGLILLREMNKAGEPKTAEALA